MRIGFFHTTLPERDRKPGGVDVFVYRLAQKLTERGHEVTVFSFSRRPPEAAFEHVQLKPVWVGHSTVTRLFAVPLLVNRLNPPGLDVLHLHGDDWFYLRRKVPTVRTFHGSALFEARHSPRWRRRLSQLAVYPLELLACRLATGSTQAVIPLSGRTRRRSSSWEPGTDASVGASCTRPFRPMSGRPSLMSSFGWFRMLFLSWTSRSGGSPLHPTMNSTTSTGARGCCACRARTRDLGFLTLKPWRITLLLWPRPILGHDSCPVMARLLSWLPTTDSAKALSNFLLTRPSGNGWPAPAGSGLMRSTGTRFSTFTSVHISSRQATQLHVLLLHVVARSASWQGLAPMFRSAGVDPTNKAVDPCQGRLGIDPPGERLRHRFLQRAVGERRVIVPARPIGGV
jgi:Glycosyltransferase Family 4